MKSFLIWFLGAWVAIIVGGAFLFWPLAVWPDNPNREMFWFGFLVVNLFAALFAANQI